LREILFNEEGKRVALGLKRFIATKQASYVIVYDVTGYASGTHEPANRDDSSAVVSEFLGIDGSGNAPGSSLQGSGTSGRDSPATTTADTGPRLLPRAGRPSLRDGGLGDN
jgi:hypothetical protein